MASISYNRIVKINNIPYRQVSASTWINQLTGQSISNSAIAFLSRTVTRNTVTQTANADASIVIPLTGPSGACCKGGTCIGIYSASGCAATGGVWAGAEAKCVECIYGAYCSGLTCEGLGYVFENKTPTFIPTGTCAHCLYGVCCTPDGCLENGLVTQQQCAGVSGTFFVGLNSCNLCNIGSCCTGGNCVSGGLSGNSTYRGLCTSGVGEFFNARSCFQCTLGACCTGGTCQGIISRGQCNNLNGIFYAGASGCSACESGVFCAPGGTACSSLGFRGDNLTSVFIQGATCNACERGTCCTPSGSGFITQVDVSRASCNGIFFKDLYKADACATGSCCIPNGYTCNANVFRYDCQGDFNQNANCSACETGACCFRENQRGYPCEPLSRWDCQFRQGTFLGGQTCSACNTRSCCESGICRDIFVGEVCNGITYEGIRCIDAPCLIGSCCTGGTCMPDMRKIDCMNISGIFTDGFDCSTACVTGAACEIISETEYDCIPDATKAQYGNIELYPGRTCGVCVTGVCCTGGIQLITNLMTCEMMGGIFFEGVTETACDSGIFCTGAGLAKTCIGTGLRGQNISGEFLTGGNCEICINGACCKGGTCISETFMTQKECVATGGYFFPNAGCTSCITGVFCNNVKESIPCNETGYFGQNFGVTFIAGKTCSACDVGVCCTGASDCHSRVRRQYCDSIGGNFVLALECGLCEPGVYCTGFGPGITCLGPGKLYEQLSPIFIDGGTCSDCYSGIFCTGSGIFSTCFAPGYKAQNLTNVFIAGGTCTDCQFAACCTGGSCIGITSISKCQLLGGITFIGQTCSACDMGSFCTGPYTSIGQPSLYTCAGANKFRGENLGNIFITGATCSACDGGVFCTGSDQNITCIGSGYRGQSFSSDFRTTTTANCNLCIHGACCTGGTCAGITSASYCTTVGGTFYAGLTCFACLTEGQSFGACCTGGSCAGLTSSGNCTQIGGVFLPGATCSSCDYGAFCQGLTCARLGYRGENISSIFYSGATCSSCIQGVCCKNGSCLTGQTSELFSQKECEQVEGATFIMWTPDFKGCRECEYGMFCTGSSQYDISCYQAGIRAEEKSSSFIPQGTCDDCSFGICCSPNKACSDTTDHDIGLVLSNWGRTGPTGIYFSGDYDGDGVVGVLDLGLVLSNWYGTKELCQARGGIYYRGRTCGGCSSGSPACLACDTGVYCTGSGEEWSCLGVGSGFANLGGVYIQGANNCEACEYGVFCIGQTCAGVTLRGFELSDRFEQNENCSTCIQGVCCLEGQVSYIGTQIECEQSNGTFNAGTNNLNVCNDYTQLSDDFGICCNEGNCQQYITQAECDGQFNHISLGISFGLSCETNACELGICCKENAVTSVTGGQCLGEMTRIHCVATGGNFLSYSRGATCSNCSYIPMLASALFEGIRSNAGTNIPSSGLFPKQVSGETGNEIQPRLESKFKAVGNFTDKDDTWLSKNHNMYGELATTLHSVRRKIGNGSQGLEFPDFRIENFKPWWTPGSTGILMSRGWTATALGITYGIHDVPPPFSLGYISQYTGNLLGYILDSTGNTGNYGVARYIKLILGYNNPEDPWHNTELVYRYAATDKNGPVFTLNDAVRHAQLVSYPAINEFPSNMPFIQAPNANGEIQPYSSPILVSVFAENPLKHRIRPIGSCCVGITCMGIITQDHCQFLGGTFNERLECSACSPELLFGNCCTGGTYAGYTNLAHCSSLGGKFFKGSTSDATKCIYGTICDPERVCSDPENPQSYYGEFSEIDGKFFVENENLGCASCNYGLCCAGSTCYGRQTKSICDSYNGTLYYNETNCLGNCDMGVCCKMDGSCGVYTNRANCNKGDEVFVEGYGSGQLCTACETLMILKEYVSGVTYDYVFNKSTTYGTFQDGSYWVQESPNLKLLKVNMTYMNQDRTKLFIYGSNTKISDLQIHPNGYRGSVYIHGLMKNPLPRTYRNAQGNPVSTRHGFMSIVYDAYDFGWLHSQGSNSTEDPSNYKAFDLNKFIDTQNKLKYSGITLIANDVILSSTTNFDPNNIDFPDNASGYPYQVIKSRGNILTYGVVNCLSAEKAAFAGGTVCFRPPVCWPENDIENKPIYPVSMIEGKIPGQPGITLISLNTNSKSDKRLIVDLNQMQKYSHASEFGGGLDYQTISPLWSMGGAYNFPIIGVYGEKWVSIPNTLLKAAWGTSTRADQNIPVSTRRIVIQRIVQYGIDAWGPMMMWAWLGSGAGQRPARSRPWAMIAGYYLGLTAMRFPEASQMLANPNAIETIFNTAQVYDFEEDSQESTDFLATTPSGVCVPRSQWEQMRYGPTGLANNFRGTRQIIARRNAHERSTMIELSNDPSNLVRYYQYLGRGYSFTISKDGVIPFNGITGSTFSATGPRSMSFVDLTGITFSTPKSGNKFKIYGNFARVKFGDETSVIGDYPLSPYYSSSTKIGTSLIMHKIQIISGSGAGPTEYKILHTLGGIRDGDPAPVEDGGGWQFILDRPWQNGVPNINSVMKWYSFSESDAGMTRPTLLDSTGITTGMVFFNIQNDPYQCPAGGRSVIWDASPSPHTSYFGNSLDPWYPSYMFLDYLRRIYGVTMDIDTVPVHDYIRQYVYASPYNLECLMPWFSGWDPDTMDEVFMGASLTNDNILKSRINFARDFPGILRYQGLSV